MSDVSGNADEVRALYAQYRDSLLERLEKGASARRLVADLTREGLASTNTHALLEEIAGDLPADRRARFLGQLRRARRTKRIVTSVGLGIVALWLAGWIALDYRAWRDLGFDPVAGWVLVLKMVLFLAVNFVLWKILR